MRNRAKAMRLIGIANELLAMARELEMSAHDAAGTHRPHAAPPSPPQAAGHDHPIWVELARQTYDDRRRRSKIFKSDELFGEPAWDILLDLYICDKQGRRVSVTAACLGAGVPETTALRWLKQLERQGLLLREADRRDGRRCFVRLSELGYAKMTAYLQANRPARTGAVLPLAA